MKKKDINDKSKQLLNLAKEAGVDENYFFVTTFERYQVQLDILAELKKSIEEEGTLVQKEYVKGRKNLYTNPAISDYNRTTDSANKTVATLIRIIKNFGNGIVQEESDPLLDIINGDSNE